MGSRKTEDNYMQLLRLLRLPTFSTLKPILEAVISPGLSSATIEHCNDEEKLDQMLNEAIVKHAVTIELYRFERYELEKFEFYRKELEQQQQQAQKKISYKDLDLPLIVKLIICFSAANIDNAKEWAEELLRMIQSKVEQKMAGNDVDGHIKKWTSKVLKKNPVEATYETLEIKPYAEINAEKVTDLIKILSKSEDVESKDLEKHLRLRRKQSCDPRMKDDTDELLKSVLRKHLPFFSDRIMKSKDDKSKANVFADLQADLVNIKLLSNDLRKLFNPLFEAAYFKKVNEFADKPMTLAGEYNEQYGKWLFDRVKDFEMMSRSDVVTPGAFLVHEKWYILVLLVDAFREYRNCVYHRGACGMQDEEFVKHRKNIELLLKTLGCPSYKVDEKDDELDGLIVAVLRTWKISKKKIKSETQKGKGKDTSSNVGKILNGISSWNANISNAVEEVRKQLEYGMLTDDRLDGTLHFFSNWTLSVSDLIGEARSACVDDVIDIIGDFRRLSEWFIERREYRHAVEVLEMCREHYKKRNPDGYKLSGFIYDHLVARCYWNLGKFKEARENYKAALDNLCVESKLESESPNKQEVVMWREEKLSKIVSMRLEYVQVLIDLGDYKDADSILTDVNVQWYGYWKYYLALGNLYFQRGEYEKARLEYNKALDAPENKPAEQGFDPANATDRLFIQSNIAAACLKEAEKGRYLSFGDSAVKTGVSEALKQYTSILSSLTDLPDDAKVDPTEVLNILSSVGVALKHLHRNEDALKLHAEVLEGRKATSGVNHPSTMESRSHIASVLLGLGEYEKALKKLEKVRKFWAETLDETHPKALIDRANIARVYAALGRFEDAAREYATAIRDSELILGPDHPETQKAEKLFDDFIRSRKSIDSHRRIRGALEELGLQDKVLILKQLFPDI